MRHLDLFSGIGGFALAARWVGWETVGFCEIDPYCQKVLRKHWPDVPIFEDVHKLYRFANEYERCPDCEEPYCQLCDAHFFECECIGCSQFEDEIGSIDIISGGFPCQPVSQIGKRKGQGGNRWLWPEMLRIIAAVGPTWVVGENVIGIVDMGLDQIQTDLEALGYSVGLYDIPAASVGTNHRRRRIWIVAHSNSERLQRQRSTNIQEWSEANGHDRESHRWMPTPRICRASDGIPNKVDRLRGLGNAIVPQVAEIIFRAIDAVQTGQTDD